MPRVYERPMQDKLLEAIAELREVSRAELESFLGWTENNVLQALRGLRKRKLVYIVRYERQHMKGGRYTPYYGAGDKADAAYPKQLTHKQRNAKYRERHRARYNAMHMARRGRKYDNIWRGLL